MADRTFTRRTDGDPNPGGEYVLVGSRFAYRNDKDVLVIHKRGDKVTLNDEQAQRLRAGKPGSAFQREEDVQEDETVEVAVANEATYPAEDGSPVASPEQRTNRKVVARPVVRKAADEDTKGSDEAAEPTSSAASRAKK